MSAKQRGNRVQDIAASYKTPSRPFTCAEYLLLPDNGQCYQILRGELITSPAPETVHQSAGLRLKKTIVQILESNPVAIMLDAPLDMVFDQQNVVQPDRVVILHDRKSIIAKTNIQLTADCLPGFTLKWQDVFAVEIKLSQFL